MNTIRNIKAEAFADQVRASIREEEPIPSGPIVAAAARTIRIEDVPIELQCHVARLLEEWAESEGVDRP